MAVSRAMAIDAIPNNESSRGLITRWLRIMGSFHRLEWRGAWTLRTRRRDRHEDETCDQTQVLKESVQGHEAIVTGQRPEVVGGYHGHCGQHAKATGSQPHPAAENRQFGTCELDEDG